MSIYINFERWRPQFSDVCMFTLGGVCTIWYAMIFTQFPTCNNHLATFSVLLLGYEIAQGFTAIEECPHWCLPHDWCKINITNFPWTLRPSQVSVQVLWKLEKY